MRLRVVLNSLIDTFFIPFLAFYSDIEEETKGGMDEKMEHSAVGEFSSEQQICESANYICIVRKNWSTSHSGTGSYSRQAGRLLVRPLGRQNCCKVR